MVGSSELHLLRKERDEEGKAKRRQKRKHLHRGYVFSWVLAKGVSTKGEEGPSVGTITVPELLSEKD